MEQCVNVLILPLPWPELFVLVYFLILVPASHRGYLPAACLPLICHYRKWTFPKVEVWLESLMHFKNAFANTETFRDRSNDFKNIFFF
jgi:hypothetical protein